MTEVENLMLEHLKRFQGQLSRVEEKIEETASEMRSMKQHMGAFLTSEANRDIGRAQFRLRLERIERRLDLYEG
ncbi:hypothetical protein [Amaricoccus solimangrovi]|uniref:Uncharacterized protein n=1 Tax=Amaricoccus solimangrovi TaxID=2589815 RepID=A0A501X1D6_9RHOB|nr:hypothetical protein [Amaricoccus solimangrovi]TPE53816.1 hypothetical protein FJM51_01860 [Amaricoccus solimangrovi]